MQKTPTRIDVTVDMVDELAQVRDKLRALVARETYLKKVFRENGAGIYKGDHYQIEIGFSSRAQLDMEAVRGKLTAKWMLEHTGAVEVMNIKQMELV